MVRPCIRLKIENRDSISPGTYYRPTTSNGGYEFSQSPRLTDAIDHKLSSIIYAELINHKSNTSPAKIEEQNKEKIKNILEYTNKVKEKNEKVYDIMKNTKIKSVKAREQKKIEMENILKNRKWKENKEILVVSKVQWSKIALLIGIATMIKCKIISKKVNI